MPAPQIDPNIPAPTLEQVPAISPQNEPVQPTNASALETVFAQTAREQLQENARLRAELARRDSNQQAAQPTSQDYFANPVEVQRNIAREEITAALAPFTQDFAVMRRSQQYQVLKAQAKAALPDKFHLIENLVDVAMSNIEPTTQNMQAAVSYAFGQLYLNGSLVPTASVVPVPANPVRPPYVPPAAPPAPNNNNALADLPLTEAERRMMREGGFKDEAEFKAWRDMPATAIKPEGY